MSEQRTMRAFGKLKAECAPCVAARARKHAAYIERQQAAAMTALTGHHRCELCGKVQDPTSSICQRCRESEET